MPWKALRAKMTLVWSFPTVLTGMKTQVISCEEGSTAYVTYKRLVIGVQLSMSSKTTKIGKCGRALFTSIRPLTWNIHTKTMKSVSYEDICTDLSVAHALSFPGCQDTISQAVSIQHNCIFCNNQQKPLSTMTYWTKDNIQTTVKSTF